MSRILLILALLVSPLHAAEPPLPPDHAARMKQGLGLFSDKIRPALDTHCLNCHGGEKTRGGLDLATRNSLLEGGESGPALDLAQPDKSLLLTLLRHDEEPHMPAKEPRLPADLIADFSRWIELGAPYDQPLADKKDSAKPMTVTAGDRAFWSFAPLQPASPPDVKSPWIRNDIDRFTFASLQNKGLTPNPEADRRTLARRAHLDLLGIPPSPEEIDAFLADPAPDAFPNLLSRLLDSPHFGERQARHWMDVARFAESTGFEHDYDRPTAYHYRDFLIRAFNADIPWDQMVGWQIAGDELAPENPLALTATGFLSAGVFPTQITEAEFERARYDELDDMVGTTGIAFLGLSVACARCHDHKFDPIPASDYYRLAATFATAIRSEKEIPINSGTLDLAPWEQKKTELESALTKYQSEALSAGFESWLRNPPAPDPAAGANWYLLEPVSVISRDGATLTRQPDASWLASGTNPTDDEYTLVASAPAAAAALRIEALTHPSFPRNGPGRASNGNFGLGHLTVTSRPLSDPKAAPVPVKITDARATHQQNTAGLSVKSSYDNDPNKSGWAVDLGGIGKDQAAIFVFDNPLAENAELTVTMRFHVNTQHSLGRFRLALSTDPAADFHLGKGTSLLLAHGLETLRSKGAAALSPSQREALLTWFALQDDGWNNLQAELQNHLAAKPKPETKKAMVCSEGVKPMTNHADGRGYPHFYKDVHFLTRGDPKQKGEPASQGFLQILMPGENPEDNWILTPPPGATTSFRRASLAAWLTNTQSGAGHLLARVIVNRIWQQHFGTGIVATPNDFGFQGDRPSHPDLLDFLASDLIRNGWKLKRLHHLIMASATYRQSAAFDPTRSAADADNRLLWRFPTRRLEAEAIRDSLLAVSQLLDPTPFGPGSLDENHRRRSVYFTIKRSRFPNVMIVFDWPEHLVSIGKRPSTTVAPQALYFMNSPHARQYADALAKRAAGSVDALYAIALSRPPTPEEKSAAASFLTSQSAIYAPAPDAPARALADFTQALLSSNEFLHLP